MEEIVEVCQEISDKVNGVLLYETISELSIYFFHLCRLEDLISLNYQNRQLHSYHYNYDYTYIFTGHEITIGY